jgi:hypothetical protein
VVKPDYAAWPLSGRHAGGRTEVRAGKQFLSLSRHNAEGTADVSTIPSWKIVLWTEALTRGHWCLRDNKVRTLAILPAPYIDT